MSWEAELITRIDALQAKIQAAGKAMESSGQQGVATWKGGVAVIERVQRAIEEATAAAKQQDAQMAGMRGGERLRTLGDAMANVGRQSTGAGQAVEVLLGRFSRLGLVGAVVQASLRGVNAAGDADRQGRALTLTAVEKAGDAESSLKRSLEMTGVDLPYQVMGELRGQRGPFTQSDQASFAATVAASGRDVSERRWLESFNAFGFLAGRDRLDAAPTLAAIQGAVPELAGNKLSLLAEQLANLTRGRGLGTQDVALAETLAAQRQIAPDLALRMVAMEVGQGGKHLGAMQTALTGGAVERLRLEPAMADLQQRAAKLPGLDRFAEERTGLSFNSKLALDAAIIRRDLEIDETKQRPLSGVRFLKAIADQNRARELELERVKAERGAIKDAVESVTRTVPVAGEFVGGVIDKNRTTDALRGYREAVKTTPAELGAAFGAATPPPVPTPTQGDIDFRGATPIPVTITDRRPTPQQSEF